MGKAGAGTDDGDKYRAALSAQGGFMVTRLLEETAAFYAGWRPIFNQEIHTLGVPENLGDKKISVPLGP